MNSNKLKPMSPEERKAAYDKFNKNPEFFPQTLPVRKPSKGRELGASQKTTLLFMALVVLAVLTYDWLTR